MSSMNVSPSQNADTVVASESKKIPLGFVVTGIILAVVLTEFVLSPLLQQRAQRQLFNQFKVTTDLAASAFGQAGISPLPDTAPAYGSAVALLQIPKLGINQIVVEGTSSSYTQAGPGHVPGTVLPGQAGESDIIGRRTTFGAPFYHLGSLRVGDIVNVTTVEGPAVYKVIPAKLAQSSSNILKLITSSPPILATGSTSIYAALTKNPYPLTPKNARTTPASNQFALLVLLLEVLLVVLYVTRGIYRRFGTLVGWLILTPLVIGSVLALTLALDTLLPSTL